MRLAIVTGTAPYHLQLCSNLNRTFDVVGIIHPGNPRITGSEKLRKLFKRIRRHGTTLVLLNLLARSQGIFSSRFLAATTNTQRHLFSDNAYAEIPRNKIFAGCDIHSPTALELLRQLQPDVSVFLGGPVYPPAFVACAGASFNYHSGISPIYNGAASTTFAFANGHPHLCGGTLMAMGVKVDGGRIFGHYLPEVQPGDSPTSLFAKTVRGATIMYTRLLEHLQAAKGPLPCIPQPNPLFYTRAFEFGLYQQAMIIRHLRTDLPARYKRPEAIVEYWREATDLAAQNLYRSTMDHLLWGASSLSLT
jgi:hypothetical protein